eukprot:TRINITY_DN6971_c0_g1_i1.p1 TRINITY_DN6971_c0_g1~~TRINITY_DN6971_c0_g1_i1.p1  ORF type:complete len:335 (-),score=63.27 TRINITY_DN6971_c0_g1_i1:44-1048(-)
MEMEICEHEINSSKPWESVAQTISDHYDPEFYIEPYSFGTVRNSLRLLSKELALIGKELNISFVLLHGSLLGQVINKGVLDWDVDIDVSVPVANLSTLATFAPKYNSMNSEKSILDLRSLQNRKNEKKSKGKKTEVLKPTEHKILNQNGRFQLNMNPAQHLRIRTHESSFVIDGRLIDRCTSVYVDITGLTCSRDVDQTKHDHTLSTLTLPTDLEAEFLTQYPAQYFQPLQTLSLMIEEGLLNTKNSKISQTENSKNTEKGGTVQDKSVHIFKESDIWPLKEAMFEEVKLWIPRKSCSVLTSLYQKPFVQKWNPFWLSWDKIHYRFDCSKIDVP